MTLVFFYRIPYCFEQKKLKYAIRLCALFEQIKKVKEKIKTTCWRKKLIEVCSQAEK